MRRWVPAMLLALCLLGSSSAQAAYDHASRTLGPAAGEYSASITGVQATTDVVFVLDNSGSMAQSFGGGGSKWDAVSAATKTFVEQLGAGGLFARGGKVGVVLFSTGTSELAPTADQSAIDQKINEGAPSSESCISCGLQRAAELLAAIPDSSGHRRLIYLLADGANTPTTPTPPTLEEALAADNAAGAVRRVIGVGSGAEGNGLEALDSDGAVTYPESQQALGEAYSAEPTSFPGATNVSWAFHLTSDVTPSGATASLGTATVSGSDVTWAIPSLGAETATLTIRSTPSAGAKSCEPKGFLSGMTFSDAEGDAAPSFPPEAVPAISCGHLDATVISLPKAPAKCWRRKALTVKVTPPSGVGVANTVVKLTGRKAKTYKGKSAAGKITVAGLPKGSYKVKVTVTLDDGTSQTATRSYRTCATKRKR